MRTKQYCKVTNYIKEKIHLATNHFMFTITDLNFQYSNSSITLNAKAKDFSVPSIEANFLDIIKADMLYIIKANGLEDKEFNFDYNREHFHELVLSQMRELVDWFNDFLYKFSFIDSATINFSGNEIFFLYINDLSPLCSVKKYCQEEFLAQFLMEKNIKEIDFLKLQETLNNNRSFIQNRENYSLLRYYTKGSKYSRTNYEATLEQKDD